MRHILAAAIALLKLRTERKPQIDVWLKQRGY
ncbi:hypothetical protein STPYR_10386 [uncultured Stenotrophomonas sp.]|uniref:Uncharacterized protein n=1 Tax=uncultured Stenotrophomonas sp. TaxID=165438 RepID=A0A1Y5Q3K0_9GAMM|nr:hypothetical protein STPYR_10386 [uncultured Stenotrophomonas sp.]